MSQGEMPSADENVEATDLDRKPVAVLPLHRAEDTVQRSATGRVDPRGKKSWPSKPGGDLHAPWPQNEQMSCGITPPSKTRFSVQIARFQFLARSAEVRPPSSVK